MLTLALIASSLLAQVGDCGPGKECVSKSFQPSPCYATGSLPTCNATKVGQIRCDSTQSCLVACFGGAWSCVATASTISPVTVASYAGWFADGGSTATYPQALRVEVGSGGIWTDGGVYAKGDVNSEGSVRTYDSTNNANVWRQSTFNGTTSFEQNGSSVYACAVSGTTCTYANYGITLTNGSVSAGGSVRATTFLKTTGVATGSLPTCNGAAEGQIETDTTIDRPVFCDGTQHVWPVGNIAGFFPGQATIAAADNITIANQRLYSGGNIQRIGVASLLAGTAGGAETYTIDVYNNTTSTVLCTKAAVACTTATISSADCANVAYAAADDIRIRVHCSTCTTCPMMMVNVEYQ